MSQLKEKCEKCLYCKNYYGPNFDEPFCITCHYFIYPNIVEIENTNELTSNTQIFSGNSANNLTENSANALNSNETNQADSARVTQPNQMNIDSLNHRNFFEKLESNDSGNEDSDTYEQTMNNLVLNQNLSQQLSSTNNSIILINHSQPENAIQGRETSSNSRRNNSLENFARDGNLNNNNYRAINYAVTSTRNYTKGQSSFNKISNPLNEQIYALSEYRSYKSVNYNVFESLPNEVLLCIFRNLDDLSLWSISFVCKKWNDLIKQEISQNKWKLFIKKRWVLFKSAIQVDCYQRLYSQLVESSNCFYCLSQIHIRENSYGDNEFKKSWRHRRLLLELKALQADPPDGICAKPLERSCFHWQASITGPSNSPYEGGIFFLYLQIPQSYPLNPPLVRFITKIYHPNISRHGEIGLDSIHENWSLALTISKILISIQSLLTDPYTHVCMEKEIGDLYNSNRELYEKNAKTYTLKYAMTDFIIFDNQSLKLFNQMNGEVGHSDA